MGGGDDSQWLGDMHLLIEPCCGGRALFWLKASEIPGCKCQRLEDSFKVGVAKFKGDVLCKFFYTVDGECQEHAARVNGGGR